MRDIRAVRPENPSETRKESIAKALASVETGRRAAVAKRASEMPQSLRLNYLRSAAGIASRARAIASFCIMCMGYDRGEVLLCTDVACPLWSFRPTFGEDDK